MEVVPPLTAVAIYAGGVISVPLFDAKRPLVIGRAKDADLVIDDPSVSRRHAMLHFGEDVELEDLGSQNGTMIVDRSPSDAGQTARMTPRRLCPGERAVVRSMIHAQLGTVTLLLQARTEASQGAAPREPFALPQGVIVASAALRQVFGFAERVAQGSINVLLLGETGVGKEVLADYIHRASPRRGGPFVQVNCATVRGEVLESELFGYERGAFPGAVAAKGGLIEAAEGGTLFLDEISGMPPDLQARLLRFLEDRRTTRVGSTESRQVDVRIVSATNSDLAGEVKAGRHRGDLYFRLHGVSIEIPPLRTRPADIVPLAQHFARIHAAALGLSPAPLVSPAALAALARLPLLGNARELSNLVERAMLLAEPGEAIHEDQVIPARPGDAPRAPLEEVEAPSDDDKLRVLAALEEHGGNQTRAAKRLGISRRALIVRLERYDIPRPRRDSEREARGKT